MKNTFKTAIGAGLLALILAGCSNDEPAQNQNSGTADDGESGQGMDTHAQSEQSEGNGHSEIGFEMDPSGEVEEAEGVPEEEKEAILNTFDQYIETFNNEDIEGYLVLLLTEEGYFNEEEERAALEEVFDSFDVSREVQLKTVNEYKDEEAHVYSDLLITTVDPANGAEVSRTGRQITVMHKVKDEWKIASIHFMANPQ
ncbi:nuclear transport factor 2 family protein [Jeotgalibacillus proteolyticus]|uniref:Uncharacterized protein n=1 Tax=Jeotgalibacillus proteolyticus TaxID=2082395 RepID=A0A2S5GB93_9BACL|nr:nuclear transport factor 2 family protein [Jeotgalibacillus proteolyticus]PPA70259.1 hypothetical protein C4B60_11805 [Jeotgalibacillus proteolyticus]